VYDHSDRAGETSESFQGTQKALGIRVWVFLHDQRDYCVTMFRDPYLYPENCRGFHPRLQIASLIRLLGANRASISSLHMIDGDLNYF